MNEILNSIRLKDKITIAAVMGAFALVLCGLVGIFSAVSVDRHAHVYDYSLTRDGDEFYVFGICTVDNCEKPYYTEKVASQPTVSSAVSPTCSYEGKKVYTYVYKGLSISYTEVLPKTDHLYEYELDSEDGLMVVNGTCTVDGCTNPYLFLYNITDLTLVSEIPGTCFTPGRQTYSYKLDGVMGSFSTYVKEAVPHTLNGVPAVELESESGKFLLGTPGINLFPGTPLSCGALSAGYYVCEVCSQAISVQVRQPFHNYVLQNGEVADPPTETREGTAFLSCTNEGCRDVQVVDLPKVEKGVNATTKSPATEISREIVTYVHEGTSLKLNYRIEIEIEIGSKLSHNYVFSLEVDKSNPSKHNLVGRCNQPECQTPQVIIEDVETTFEDTSTCLQAGMWIWTHITEDGKVYTLEVQAIGPAKHVYEQNKDKLKKPSLTEEGEIEIYCTTKGCTEVKQIILPKVVIGENATVRSEEDSYLILDYCYVTEEKVEILLIILVDK